MLIASSAQVVAASEAAVEFDAGFFHGLDQTKLRLDKFRLANQVPDGSYRLDVYLNDGLLGRADVIVRGQAGAAVNKTCLPMRFAKRLNFDVRKLSAAALAQLNDAGVDVAAGNAAADFACLDFSSLAEQASSIVDLARQRLDLSIPQAYLLASTAPKVADEDWDAGITAAYVRYQLSFSDTASAHWRQRQGILFLDQGLNLAGWRFRATGVALAGGGIAPRYIGSGLTVARDIYPIKSRFLAGDMVSGGRLLDSFMLRGVELSSDIGMMQDRGKVGAPAIRGVARTASKVEIFQSNRLIYTANVPPGEYEFTDVAPIGYGGDLEVRLTDASGATSSTIVPYSSAPGLLKQGAFRYHLNVGSLLGAGRSPGVVDAYFSLGLTDRVTLNANAQYSVEGYRGIASGLEFGTAWGAWNASYSASRYELRGQTRDGSTFKAGWAKSFEPTQTNFSMTSYRYSTEGFSSLRESVPYSEAALAQEAVWPRQRIKSRSYGMVSQGIGAFGRVNLSLMQQNYWNRSNEERSLNFNWSRNFGRASVSVAAAKQLFGSSSFGGETYSISFSMPLDFGIRSESARINASHVSNAYGGGSDMLSYSESAGVTSMGIYAQKGGAYETVGGSVSMAGDVVNGSLSASKGQDNQSITAAVSGALLVHSGGLLAMSSLGDTAALVKVEGGKKGDKLFGTSVPALDRNGYTVVPYLSGYTASTIAADLSSANSGVKMDTTEALVMPRNGAIVQAAFKKATGLQLIVKTKSQEAQSAPFGYDVFDERGRLIGAVGQGGVVNARVEKTRGLLEVKEGVDASPACLIEYDVSASGDTSDEIVFVQSQCKKVR